MPSSRKRNRKDKKVICLGKYRSMGESIILLPRNDPQNPYHAAKCQLFEQRRRPTFWVYSLISPTSKHIQTAFFSSVGFFKAKMGHRKTGEDLHDFLPSTNKVCCWRGMACNWNLRKFLRWNQFGMIYKTIFSITYFQIYEEMTWYVGCFESFCMSVLLRDNRLMTMLFLSSQGRQMAARRLRKRG